MVSLCNIFCFIFIYLAVFKRHLYIQVPIFLSAKIRRYLLDIHVGIQVSEICCYLVTGLQEICIQTRLFVLLRRFLKFIQRVPNSDTKLPWCSISPQRDFCGFFWPEILCGSPSLIFLLSETRVHFHFF